MFTELSREKSVLRGSLVLQFPAQQNNARVSVSSQQALSAKLSGMHSLTRNDR